LKISSEGAQLDVLWTVTEALVDGDSDRVLIAAYDTTIHTIAPARREIDAEDTDAAVGNERLRCRIADLRKGCNVQARRVR